MEPIKSKPGRRPRRAAVLGARVRRGLAGLGAIVVVAAGLARAVAGSPGGAAQVALHSDPTGVLGVYTDASRAQPANPFFRSLGTNGRSCATCHQPAQALGLSASYARSVYARSGGNDPLFAPIDGANCPEVAAGEVGGHSLLLKYGLIRVAMKVPRNAEFTISVVHDPYGCALRPDAATGALIVSVYRRPLPAANLRFLSAVMFDGRQTVAPLDDPATFAQNLHADLVSQARDATLTHAQASSAPTSAELDAIADYESSLYAAQTVDRDAGPLTADSAFGGPLWLASQTYYPGINDSLGGDPGGNAFSAAAMRIFGNWAPDGDADDASRPAAARTAIAAGERIFDSFPLRIMHVRGLNDNPAMGAPPVIVGTCTTCHDAPNVGDHSLPLPLDIGTSHATLGGAEPDPTIAAALAELSEPDLPVFRISGCPDPFGAGVPASFYTTDPARALVTGKCSDLDRGKGPVLRGLAARAPYFHNGAAATLGEVVDFYDRRFEMGLSDSQKKQLVAFLNSL